ncbi:MAG: TonB-dependent receptor plug domain-containing protein [Gemmatimonadaceae bacterium]|nr:TonB-dependent receptor plug domain-containing protein [Gemmatimonadaceae bacterium]
MRAVTDRDGRFRLADVPAGARTLIVSWMSSGSQRMPIQVAKRGTIELRIEYRSHPFALSEIRVTAGSRVPQWVVEAPIAIAVVDRVEARNYAATGQLPQVIKGLPGMDVSPNGIHDFNVNTRGFNSDLAQRMLVLMDGRDLAIPFLAAQEWVRCPCPSMTRGIEVARGPSAALRRQCVQRRDQPHQPRSARRHWQPRGGVRW